MKHAKALALSLFVAFAGAPVVSAHADGPPQPPEEAFTACNGKSAGDACTAPIPGHAEEGTCTAERSSDRLFCRPKAPPGPPPEALTACEGKSAEAACTVTFGDHTMNGTCVSGPDGRLACAPPHHRND